jgi:hypothetical protein
LEIGENWIEKYFRTSKSWHIGVWWAFVQLLLHLTFMGPCIVNIFQYTSNEMQLYTVYLYLETVSTASGTLHVSGGTSTHHQECTELCLQHLVFFTPLLQPATIVEEFQLLHGSGSYALLMMGGGTTRNM